MAKYIILGHTKPYDFTNDDGENFKGVYLNMLRKRPSMKDGENGNIPIIAKLNPKILDDLGILPGLYEVETELGAGKKNQPETEIVELKFIRDVIDDYQNMFNEIVKKVG